MAAGPGVKPKSTVAAEPFVSQARHGHTYRAARKAAAVRVAEASGQRWLTVFKKMMRVDGTLSNFRRA